MNDPKYRLIYYEDCSFCGGAGCTYCGSGYYERNQVFDSKDEFDHAVSMVESNTNVILVVRKIEDD